MLNRLKNWSVVAGVVLIGLSVSGCAQLSPATIVQRLGGNDTVDPTTDPSLTEAAIRKFGHNMFGGDFVFSVSRDFVKRCSVPLLLQPGTDKPHPAKTSAEIASLAPNLEVQQDWRGPTHLAESIRRVTEFLTKHTP